MLVAVTDVVIAAEYEQNEETPAALHCKAEGNPTPNVTWIDPDGEVQKSAVREARISLKSLGQGMYTCMATNDMVSRIKYYTVARKYIAVLILFNT